MYKDLSHLTKEEAQILTERYFNGESPKKLIAEYNLSVAPSNLFSILPQKVFPEHKCEYCNSALVLKRCSRTSVTYQRPEKHLYCPVCGHYPYRESCDCKNCETANALLKLTQRESIIEHYFKEHVCFDFNELSFRNKVFLGSLCRGLMNEDMSQINPLSNSGIVLAPKGLIQEVYRSLTACGVISVSPKSSLDAFNLKHEEFPCIYYLYKVIYDLNLSFPTGKDDVFNEILNPSFLSDDVYPEVCNLWKQIAINECIDYLQYEFQKVNFDFSPGEKTYKIFEILLKDFSVSQMFNIIYRQVANASKLYLERKLPKKHAANSVIRGCQRYGELAKSKGWDVYPYNRPSDLPQSVLSEYFFNRVLSIGDDGFKKPLSFICVENPYI